MSTELYWLTLTIIMTALFWVPYVLDRLVVNGTIPALLNPGPEPSRQSRWAARAIKAHENASENLVIFAPLVLMIHSLGLSTARTELAVVVYFFARLAHFGIYAAGVPVARTVAFVIGWGAQAVLALTLLGLV